MKTSWIPASIKPHHIGWYEALGEFAEVPEGCIGVAMRYWTGRHWMWKSTITGHMAVAAVSRVRDHWRGLTRQYTG